MNDDCLKLTAYFEERLRIAGGFVADAMLGLYGTHNIATSVMLRGIGGFGGRHQLHTDESLSLSEEPPVAVVGVDTRTKIESLADSVVEMTPRGLVTLERARLVDEEIDGLDDKLDHKLDDAIKLTVYVGRQERVFGVPAYYAVCDLLHRRGLAGATVFLGVDGTSHGERARASFFSRNVNVPMMIIAVGNRGQVSRVLPELGGLLRRRLLTVERVRVCKSAGQLLSRPDTLPSADERGLRLWQKLMVYTSEATLHDGVPIHRALVRRLRQSGTASGATVLRGIWGFQDGQKPHGDKVFQLSRRVPVTTIVVDTPDSITRSFDIVDELTSRHGLVTSEMVPALVMVDGVTRRGDTRLAWYRY
jgi:PII-like signaling protein